MSVLGSWAANKPWRRVLLCDCFKSELLLLLPAAALSQARLPPAVACICFKLSSTFNLKAEQHVFQPAWLHRWRTRFGSSGATFLRRCRASRWGLFWASLHGQHPMFVCALEALRCCCALAAPPRGMHVACSVTQPPPPAMGDRRRTSCSTRRPGAAPSTRSRLCTTFTSWAARALG